jgi:hypothetical protein
MSTFFTIDNNLRYLNNEEFVKNIGCPMLFIHGEEDTLIFPEHSKKLHALCGSNKKMLVNPVGMTHGAYDMRTDVVNNILLFFERFELAGPREGDPPAGPVISKAIFQSGFIAEAEMPQAGNIQPQKTGMWNFLFR